MTDLATSLQETLIDFLKPLEEVSGNPLVLADWLADLGHTPLLASDPALLVIVQRAQSIVAKLRAVDAGTLETTDGLASLLAIARETATILQDLRTFAADPARSQFATSLGDDVMSSLLASVLRRNHATAFRIASLLTLVNPKEVATMDPAIVDANGTTLRYARALDHFTFGAITGLLANPGATLKTVYLPNGLAACTDAWTAADRLFPHLAFLADTLDLSWRTESLPNGPLPANRTGELLDAEPAPDPNDPDTAQVVDDLDGPILLPLPPLTDADFAKSDPVARINLATDLALEILVASKKHPGGIPGLLLQLVGSFNRVETRDTWKLTFSSTGTLPALAIGPTSFAVVPTTSASPNGSAKFLAEKTAGPGATGPAFLLGSAKGTRLEVGSVSLSGDVSFDAQSWALSIGLDASTGALVLVPSDGDSFLSSVLPSGGLRADFDLGLAWSSARGLSLRGNAGLEATIPVGRSITGVSLQSLYLGLRTTNGVLGVELSANVAASIGPLQASLGRIGLESSLGFPQAGGNLGVADVSFGFKKPATIGLSIDVAGVVTGSGFVSWDPAQSLYAGGMQLTLHNQLTLTAIGLITTKLPDGQPGYSLLIFITADGFQPIQLGFGFMLTGIGGMLGINRTFDEGALREGLKTDSLSTILFPRDPASNASAIVRSLATAFPARVGSYLLGLLAKICWGPAQLLQFELALILELGARTRLLALGRVTAVVPRPDNDLVRLKADAIGVLDFDAGTIAVDAVLVDSRIAHKFAITGGAAFRAGWGAGPGSAFLYAVGGFNPRFVPPAGVPALDRAMIALANGDNPRLTCEAYFAVTSNTLQFGARAHLVASAAGFSLVGDVGFDVLMTSLSHFIADFHASVQLKRGSHNLFKVSVAGTLEGIRPLKLSGRATFSILWCDFSVSFHATLVDGAAAVAAAIDVVAPLVAALSARDAWRSLVGGAPHGVSLRKVPLSTSALVVDPLGQLEVRQSYLPLGTTRDVDTVDGARVAGTTRRFTLTAQVGTSTVTRTAPVHGPFAPGQYFTMSDDERLASPSFETLQAGLAIGSADIAIAETAETLVAAPLSYLAIVLDGPTLTPVPTPTPVYHDVSPAKLDVQRATGAAARAPVRRVGRSRFAVTGKPAAVAMAPERWSIAPLGGTTTPSLAEVSLAAPDLLAPALAAAATAGNWTEQRATVDRLNRAGTQWQLVPQYELAASSSI